MTRTTVATLVLMLVGGFAIPDTAGAQGEQQPGTGEGGCYVCEYVIDIFDPNVVIGAGCGLSGIAGVGFNECTASCSSGGGCTCSATQGCSSAMNLRSTSPDGSALPRSYAALVSAITPTTPAVGRAVPVVLSIKWQWNVEYSLGCSDLVLRRVYDSGAEQQARATSSIIRI
jgi:hypothetical protein